MKYNYVIIEDNLGSQKSLQQQLSTFGEFKECGIANNVNDGIYLILKNKPHLIFLDVELGNENGFDLIKTIRQFTDELPMVIMTTDYDKYAKNAVNTDVLYFLDKPILASELMIALNKFEKKFLDLLKHITIKNTEGHHFIKLENIVYICGFDNCCKVFRENQSPMLITKTLKDMENILPKPFIRVHKSYIVNTGCIEMMNTTKKRLKLLISKSQNIEENEIPIGEHYIENVKNILLTAKHN